jgi:hypothetical protein
VFDWSSLVAAPGCPAGDLHTLLYERLAVVFEAAGATDRFGRCLPGEFSGCGLVDIGGEGRVPVALPGTAAGAWWHMSLVALRDPLIGVGGMTAAQVDDALAACDADGYCSLYPTLVTVWGRRPA